MTRFKLIQITPLNQPLTRLFFFFVVMRVFASLKVLRLFRCVTRRNNPRPFPKTLSKIHRKRRIGACDLLHPILYLFRKNLNTVQQLGSTSVDFFCLFFLFYFTHTANIQSNKRGNKAAENNLSAHKFLKYVQFFFYTFYFHYKKTVSKSTISYFVQY